VTEDFYSPNNKPALADLPDDSSHRLVTDGEKATWNAKQNAIGSNDTFTIGHIQINDPGQNEGISWLGGNGWAIFESPDVFGNTAGNLQFAQGSTRRMSIKTDGSVEVVGTLYEGANRVYSAGNKPSWTDIQSTPTTLAGYGITDAAPLSLVATVDNHISDFDNFTQVHLAATGNGAHVPAAGTTSQYLRGDGVWGTPPNTTYSAMSVSEGQTATATASRTMRADYLKDIILYHSPAGARTPTAHNQAWSTITDTPTTLAGYGITDATPSSHIVASNPHGIALSTFGVTATAAELNKLDGVGTLFHTGHLPTFSEVEGSVAHTQLPYATASQRGAVRIELVGDTLKIYTE
jgi:hypothetical protein